MSTRFPSRFVRLIAPLALLCGSLILRTAPLLQARTNTVDPVFGGAGLGLLHQVRQLAVQPDSKLLVAGGVRDLVRLNTDGSEDLTFHARVNGLVSALAVQRNGKIVIVGGFTSINGEPNASPNIARLHPDGGVDETFFFSGDTDLNAPYEALTVAIQPDGKILLGGLAQDALGERTSGIVRLNHDGSVDTGFSAKINLAPANAANPNCVYTVLVQADRKILIGGVFTKVNGVARDGFARLNADGTLDAAYAPPIVAGAISAGSLQPDGKLLVVGRPVVNGRTKESAIVRVNDDGTLDPDFHYAGPSFASYFDYDFDALIRQVAVESDGRILALPGAALIRLNHDGSADAGFHVAPERVFLVSMLPQPDGTILLGGEFSAVAGRPSDGVAKLRPDGTVDTDYALDATPGPNGLVYSMIPQASGKIVISGNFSQLNGITHNYVARLNADGTPDGTFNPIVDDLTVLATQPDGKIVLGGYFSHVNGVFYTGLARLNVDGSLDTTFNPTLILGTEYLPVLAVQFDGKILVGTDFVRSVNLPSNLYRLNLDGSIDATFHADLGGRAAHCLVPQIDGKILVGGFLASSGETATAFVIRLYPDGSIDPDFLPTFEGSNYDGNNFGIKALAVQDDGKILAGGRFSTVNGTAVRNLVRLNNDGSVDPSFRPGARIDISGIALASDHRILVTGYLHYGIFVLSNDGSISPFVPDGVKINGLVQALVPQADGKVLLGGAFSRVDDTPRNFVARLTGNGTPDFFAGWISVGDGFDYLQFPGGAPFGFYTMTANGLAFPYLYHADLGLEYFVDARDGQSGAYLYDFASSTFFYTGPRYPFPYLYDFTLKTALYYYPDPDNPGRYNQNGVRYFYDFARRTVITK